MKQEDKDLLRTAMEYVESHYPPDCPYYIQLTSSRMEELKKANLVI